jgi:hypothetical protein
MQLAGSRKVIITLIAFAIIGLGSVSCGESATVEPTDLSPLPTGEVEVFESPILPEATLPPLVLEEGFGGVKGVVKQFPSSWEGQVLYVYLAPFFPGEEQGGGGIYVLEPSIHPSAEINSTGAFQIGNVEPGQYVVVVGPNPEDALVLLDGDRPRVIDVSEGTVLELDALRLQ